MRIADDEPRIIVDNHVDKNVARKNFFLDDAPSAVLEFGFVMHGNDNIKDNVFETLRGDFLFKSCFDFFFKTGKGVNDIPCPFGNSFGFDNFLFHGKCSFQPRIKRNNFANAVSQIQINAHTMITASPTTPV